VTEDNTAHRPSYEAHREREIRDQGPGDRVQIGKEQLIKDQTGRRTEDEKVVPLDGGANGTRKRHFTGGDLLT
jgi:hypothetical protein